MKRFNEFAKFMGHVGDLKKLDRTGWARRGIQNPESVADHSFRTTIMALVLADGAGVDQNKAVKIGLIHEFEDNKTPEAQFVERLDKLEMMLQAHEYGIDQPNVDLHSFWDHIKGFDFGDLKEVYDDLETTHNSK